MIKKELEFIREGLESNTIRVTNENIIPNNDKIIETTDDITHNASADTLGTKIVNLSDMVDSILNNYENLTETSDEYKILKLFADLEIETVSDTTFFYSFFEMLYNEDISLREIITFLNKNKLTPTIDNIKLFLSYNASAGLRNLKRNKIKEHFYKNNIYYENKPLLEQIDNIENANLPEDLLYIGFGKLFDFIDENINIYSSDYLVKDKTYLNKNYLFPNPIINPYLITNPDSFRNTRDAKETYINILKNFSANGDTINNTTIKKLYDYLFEKIKRDIGFYTSDSENILDVKYLLNTEPVFDNYEDNNLLNNILNNSINNKNSLTQECIESVENELIDLIIEIIDKSNKNINTNLEGIENDLISLKFLYNNSEKYPTLLGDNQDEKLKEFKEKLNKNEDFKNMNKTNAIDYFNLPKDIFAIDALSVLYQKYLNKEITTFNDFISIKFLILLKNFFIYTTTENLKKNIIEELVSTDIFDLLNTKIEKYVNECKILKTNIDNFIKILIQDNRFIKEEV